VQNLVQADLFGRAPEVIIDVHEVKNTHRNTSITIFMNFLKERDIPFRIEKLEVGDILLPSGYAIERKTVKDFCQSLFGTREGRLRLLEQVRSLVETYENPILLLEGGLAIRPDPIHKVIYVPVRRTKIRERIWSVIEEEIRIHPNQLEGALNDIQQRGIRIIKTIDAYHGAIILLNLLKEAKKEAQIKRKQRYPIVRSKPKLKTLIDQQLFFLSGLPGISVMRAKKILKMYKTPYNAILKVKRWDVDVEGIGTKTLDQVLKVLFTEYVEKDGDE